MPVGDISQQGKEAKNSLLNQKKEKGTALELSRVFPSLLSNLPALFLPVSPSFPSPLFLCLFTSPPYFSRSLSIAPSTGRSAFEKRRMGRGLSLSSLSSDYKDPSQTRANQAQQLPTAQHSCVCCRFTATAPSGRDPQVDALRGRHSPSRSAQFPSIGSSLIVAYFHYEFKFKPTI